MSNQPNPTPQGVQATPAIPVKPVPKKWADMTVTEREKAKAEGMAKAVTAVKNGAKSGIQIKVGDHTLTLRPTGVSEKGSLAYGYKPAIILYEGQRLRINKISFSLLKDGESTEVDWDHLTVPATE